MPKIFKVTLAFAVLSSMVLLQSCSKDKEEPGIPPVAKFTFISDNGFEAPSNVTFDNASTGATAYEWDFGDGSAKVSTENPVHEYTSSGAYNVTLTAKNGSATHSTSATVTIAEPIPTASFTFVSNNNFTTPSEITFTNTSTGSSTYEWDFGDGSDKVTEEHPVHTYSATGDYTVTLTASGETLTDEETALITITPAEPVADFTFTSDNDFHTPSVITFINTSTSAMSYEWDFGDGSATSTEENPVHTYTTTGNYTVTLTATNETLTDEKSVIIEITPFQPVANFTHVSDNGYHTPSIVTFTNSSEHAASYEWDFGDGSTSTEENPAHTYTATGSYTVILTATNETLTNEKTVIIDITPFQPVAAFTYTSDNGFIAPSTITFTSTSQHAASLSWDFGDGSAPTNVQNPVHSYSSPGSYTVTLTATNETLTDVTTEVITISAMAYTGTYKLVSAIIAKDVVIAGTQYFVGDDVTNDAQAIFDVVSCGNSSDRAMDLRFAGDVVFVCIGSTNETLAGTWTGNSNTQIINISFTSPPYPEAFTLLFENVDLTGSTLTAELIEAVLPGSLFGLPDPITVSLAVVFEQQ